jgi:hypothetical protein
MADMLVNGMLREAPAVAPVTNTAVAIIKLLDPFTDAAVGLGSAVVFGVGCWLEPVRKPAEPGVAVDRFAEILVMLRPIPV